MIVPTLLAPDGTQIEISLANDYLVAGSIAALVAWRSRNLLITLGTGMAALWAWRWLLTLSLAA